MKKIVKSVKKQNGITLVALVITIIVLLLLAVVSINIVQNSGLIEKTKLAKEEHRASAIQEQLDLLKNEQEIAKQNNETEPSINELIDKLQEQKLITEEEKNTIMQTGKITIGSKELTFSTDAILPQGYTKCEYLESTGVQYIDTGIVATNNTKVKIDFSFTKNEQSGLLGGRVGFKNNSFSVQVSSTKYITFGFGNNTDITSKSNDTNRHTILKDKSKNYYDGVLISENQISNTFSTKHNVFLFSINNNGTPYVTCNAKIYNFKFYENDTLIQDLIPCLDNNAIPCMYDTISGQTFYNQGTGEFIAGPVIE